MLKFVLLFPQVQKINIKQYGHGSAVSTQCPVSFIPLFVSYGVNCLVMCTVVFNENVTINSELELVNKSKTNGTSFAFLSNGRLH